MNVSLAIVQVAIPFGCYYLFLAALPPIFSDIYKFTPEQIGLCSISTGVGSCLGSIIPGRLSDIYCARKAAKNNGMAVAETRLRLAFYVLPVIFVGILMYGWFLHTKLPWFAPIIALAVSSFGIIFLATINSAYLVDLNPKAAASAIALNTFARSFFAMIFSLASVKMRDRMGDGWML